MNTVDSAQTFYSGQPGYNDCMLCDVRSISGVGCAPFKPGPATIRPPPTAPRPSTTISAKPGMAKKQATLEETQALFLQALKGSFSLPASELRHHETRLLRILPCLAPVHLDLIYSAVETVLGGGSEQVSEFKRQEARRLVVDHMVQHNGVSVWALSLRRIVESLTLAG